MDPLNSVLSCSNLSALGDLCGSKYFFFSLLHIVELWRRRVSDVAQQRLVLTSNLGQVSSINEPYPRFQKLTQG